MKYSTLDDFITDLPANAAQAKRQLKGHDALFFLNTREGRAVAVSVTDGDVTLTGQTGEPDCRVTASEGDLLRIINGQLAPAAALLFGKVRVSGNPAKLLEFIRLMNA